MTQPSPRSSPNEAAAATAKEGKQAAGLSPRCCVSRGGALFSPRRPHKVKRNVSGASPRCMRPPGRGDKCFVDVRVLVLELRNAVSQHTAAPRLAAPYVTWLRGPTRPLPARRSKAEVKGKPHAVHRSTRGRGVVLTFAPRGY